MAKKETPAKKTAASDVAATPFTLRLDADIRAELEKISKEDDRSISWLIHRALRYWLDHGAK
jgi:predicted transcriptional regulator